MKIRYKITLWISGIALFTAVSLSAFIYDELLEEPLRLFDYELKHMANALFEQGQKNPQDPWHFDVSHLPYSPDRYWIKIFDQNNTVLYQSAITKYTDIPPSGSKSRYTIEKIIPREQIWLNQDKSNEVTFRVRVFTRKIDNHGVIIRIAKPIEELEEELLGVLREAAAGLTISVLLIIVISYTIAGKILSPMVTMNRTARKITEKSLNQRIPVGKNHDELDNLATSLNQMFDRLQYSFARQKEFIGNASHELKSPITLLMLTQEELLMNSALPMNVRTDMERQLNTMRRMSKLVRNLLDLSRLEQQESLTIESLDLGELIKNVLNEYQEMLISLNIDVTINLAGDLILSGDREKLLRLLINLIDNAIQYNIVQNGRLNICAKKEKGMIVLDILNTGLEIPADDLDRIFNQFYRIEKSRSSDHGGCGLGLTIARKIVDLHNGTIGISNEKRGWIKVTVRLPLDLEKT